MNIEEKDLTEGAPDATVSETTSSIQPNDTTVSAEDESKLAAIDELEEDIIRNDTIPETSKDTPGSNGAFPVGAFDTSKD